MADTSTKNRAVLEALTPVLIVDDVEQCLGFWVDGFGFEVTNRVPGDDGKLVFASAQKGPVEVMYQTRKSVADDMPGAATDLNGHSIALFIKVDDLDAVEKSLADAPVVKPRHQTFYGSTEIYVKEPGGNTVGFAQFG